MASQTCFSSGGHVTKRVECVFQGTGNEWFDGHADFLSQFFGVVTRDDDTDRPCPCGGFSKDARLITGGHSDVITPGSGKSFHGHIDGFLCGELLDFAMQLMAVGDESSGTVDGEYDAFDGIILRGLLQLSDPAFSERGADHAFDTDDGDPLSRPSLTINKLFRDLGALIGERVGQQPDIEHH